MEKHQHPAYLIFILVLSLLALATLAIETLFKLDPNTRMVLGYADYAVCVLFFLDFIVLLVKSEKKLRYLFTWGWLDLLSSIPAINVLRLGRAARIMRIFRVMRGVRSAKIISSIILERRAQSIFLAVVLVSIILVSVSSISVLHFETTPDANIKTPGDAVWWSIVTLATVGYGDRYPVTTEGRVVATILMIAGIGLFGTFSGFVAAWFIGPAQTARKNEIKQLQEEVSEIKNLIRRLKKDERP